MTPIQELIKEIGERVKVYEDAENLAKSMGAIQEAEIWQGWADIFIECKGRAEDKLQSEREAIENAYKAGYSEGCNTIDPEGRKYKNAEDYYNQTLNQK
jgi:hypothetical protein